MGLQSPIRPAKIVSYAVEVDGVRTSSNLSFVDAVSAAMKLRENNFHSHIHVCDADDPITVSKSMSEFAEDSP